MVDNIFEEIKRMQREMNRIFSNFWGRREFEELQEAEEIKIPEMRKPLADIEESDKEVVIKFEIPGVDKRDIQLNITQNKIEVRVERKQEEKIKREGFYRLERSYGGFYRSISLPTEVIPEKAKAKYRDGILEVRIPKVKKKQSKIEIE